MNWRLRVVAATGILLGHGSQVSAQTGCVRGIVQDRWNSPVAGALLGIQETTRSVSTREVGEFEFCDLAVGTCTIVVRRVGYRTVTQTLIVRANDTTTVHLTLNEADIDLSPIVVTGTRTDKLLASAPIKTELVSRREIERIGAKDLKDVLGEQTALTITQDHGSGVQVQGLDPAYTLILVDGEPVIGRTAGTLELSRISVGDVERVEIVKGPSSSLYGSEALAGVINVITGKLRFGNDDVSARLHSRYGTYNTLDAGTTVELSMEGLATSITLNRNSSSGYDLTPWSISPTSPPYTDYTISPKLIFRLADSTVVSFNSRIFSSNQESQVDLVTTAGTVRANEKSTTTDWRLTPAIEHHFNATTKLSGTLHLTRYNNDYTLTNATTGAAYSADPFQQSYMKAETQLNAALNATHVFTAGAGYILETVTADRVNGGNRKSRSVIAYAQHEWLPVTEVDIVASARFDSHSDYASHLSPKLTLLVAPLEWMKFRFSTGSGFKAPTFQELYLDFSNPSVGYSVFGSTNVRERMAQLQSGGQIHQVLIDPSTLEDIRPEYSISFNAGLDISPADVIAVSLNLFRNNLREMIETAPIAMKTNGQNVFTYFNLSRVFTQGIESGVHFTPLDGVSFDLGYQYLEAFDTDALDAVRAGSISKVGATGRVRPVQESEYGGLFNRSQHSGTLKLAYHHAGTGFAASLRGIMRGRYGFADVNGNTILDDDKEYAPGYVIWHCSVSQRIVEHITLQFGIENLLDKQMTQFVPSLPGRMFFGAVSITY